VQIQPLRGSVDYFQFLGFERRLNLDGADLERRYHELSRQFHPDYYVGRSPIEREASLERSAALNRAYQTLKDPWKRAEYLILTEQVPKPSRKQSPSGAPPALIEEVFELNEALDEWRQSKTSGAENSPARRRIETLRSGLQSRREELLAQLGEQFDAWDAAAQAQAVELEARKAILLRLQQILDEQSYLRTLFDNIAKTLD
jgi:molecular chaperone HscB